MDWKQVVARWRKLPASEQRRTRLARIPRKIARSMEEPVDQEMLEAELERRTQPLLREGSAGVEGMADVARRFGKTRRTAGAGGLEIEPVERAELALQEAELAPADFREEDVGGKPSKVHP